MSSRILVVEDETRIADFLVRGLSEEGYVVEHAPNGQSAWLLLQSESWDLVLLDWWLPGEDGIDVLKRFRQKNRATPVLFLTARDAVSERVAGLDAGADDYLTKPFDPDELRARIHVGRRTLDLITNVKRLSGLLPICSYCKSIRSDKDYWEQVDRYLSEHTDLKLTHGICPKCLPKVLAELDDHATTLDR